MFPLKNLAHKGLSYAHGSMALVPVSWKVRELWNSIGNTWFHKKDFNLITYSSGGHSTQVDYTLHNSQLVLASSSSALKVKTLTAPTAVVTAAGIAADTANHVESAWSKLIGPLLDAAY